MLNLSTVLNFPSNFLAMRFLKKKKNQNMDYKIGYMVF